MEEVKKLFQVNTPVMEMLFQYVLHYREHYVDTLRHLTKDLFKNILNLHVLSLDIGLTPEQSPLLEKMCHYLVKNVSPYSQGKYGLLACIVDLIGTHTILQWYPLLPDVLFTTLTEASLVSHISDLLETLFRKCDSTEVDEQFITIWLKPLLKHLCTLPKDQITAMNEQLLPKLFKVHPKSVYFLHSELTKRWHENKGNCFSALIVCAKFLQRQEPEKSVFDFIKFRSLVNALSHSDDQVRLSALALVCENPKTTEIVPADTFKLMRSTLHRNINCQSPAFRQQFVACLKKLFNRMDKSRYAIERKMLEGSEIPHSSTLEAYEEFLNWLKNFLYKCLFPGANFPRRVTALNILTTLHSIFLESFKVVSEPTEVETLVHALQDTYENNKISALKLLVSCDSSIFEKEISEFSASIFKTAIILSSSSKPPDTMTASYMFALMVQYDCFREHFNSHLSAQIKDNVCFKRVVDLPSFDLVTSSSLVIAVLMLAGELLRHLSVAKISLLNAAAYTPLYGVLACIRKVISLVNFRNLKDSESLIWSCLIQELISLSIEVAATVEPVVCNSSPEGHLPMDTDSENIEQLQNAVRRAIGTRFHSAVIEPDSPTPTSEGVVLDMTKTRAVTAQILLLCCWRTHKEVSLLFGEMAEKIPVSDLECGDGGSTLLSVSQIMAIGEYFIRQMTLVKHKGAFEQAFIGFSQLCHMLWRSNVTVLHELPKDWLNDLFLAIRGLKENQHLCSTRRSAGLPFIVQALLTSDPGLSNSSFFKGTISSLLSMALGENGKHEEKIHALNILRALFRDACLSDVLIPFVSEGLKASITGFKSQSWAVRNSSTLLFSALMIRIFGVNHTQDEAGKKNRLTGKTFFTYYKDTYSFLYEEMEHCASILSGDQNSISLVPALYPILLILGRLYPDPGDNDPRLASFIPFLQICGNSAVWKVRVLTAKALVPLISVENVVATLHSLFDSLPQSETDCYYQNKIHGSCLQIISILREVPNMPQAVKISIENSLPKWMESYYHIASVNNKCYTTRAAFLEIFLLAMTIGVPLGVCQPQQLINETLTEIRKDSVSPDNERYLCLATIISLLYLTKKKPDQAKSPTSEIPLIPEVLLNVIVKFLSSHYEVVHCTVLHIFHCIFRQENLFNEADADEPFDFELSFYPVYFKDFFTATVRSLFRLPNKDIVGQLAFSEDFHHLLISTYLKKNPNSSCLGILYQLFTVLPHIIDVSWDFLPSEGMVFCNCLKLKHLLSLIQISKREDVLNEMLLYTSAASVRTIKELWHFEEREELPPFTCFQCAAVLRRWCAIIKESAQPGNCLARRKVALKSFQLIFEPTTVNSLRFLEGNSADLWQGLACLLMDDEPEIKDGAANIVMTYHAFKEPDEASVPVVSGLALDYLMQLFVEEKACHPTTHAVVFLNWILSCQKLDPGAVGDEQPFDRGELNVFAEDLTLTKLAAKHLRRLRLWPDTRISSRRITCWSAQNPRTLSLYEVVELCLTECEELVQGIISRCSVSTFLDPYCDNDLIRICQRLTVIDCMHGFVTANCKNRARDFYDFVSTVKCRTVFVKSMLSDLEGNVK